MARIYLFRGLAGDIFSTGMDRLARRLNDLGHEATVHRWINRSSVQRKIVEAYKNSRDHVPLVAIGHSLGGNSANWMTDELAKKGIIVAYTATVDATDPRPNRAVTADNFMSRDFRAKPVPGAIDIRFPELNHIEVAEDRRVHERIIDRVSALN